jgi:hypothetical protein
MATSKSSATLNWRVDDDAATKLKKAGITWVKKTLALADIDVEGSRRNNARMQGGSGDRYNPLVAQNYGLALWGGDRFPMLMVRLPDPGFKGHYILSGNHRAGGVEDLAKEGLVSRTDKIIETMLVDCVDEMLRELITRSANRWLGIRQGDEEAMGHVLYMQRTYGTSLKHLADFFNVKPTWLNARLANADLQYKLIHEHNVPAEGLNQGVLAHLNRLRFNESLLRKAATLIAQHRPKEAVVKTFVDAIKTSSVTSEGKALETIKEWEHKFRDTDTSPRPAIRTVKRTSLMRFKRVVTDLNNFMAHGKKGHPFESIADIGLTDKHERHELRQTWRATKRLVDEAFRNGTQ